MFDVKTGLLLWSLEALTLAAVLLVAWAHDRKTRTYLLWSVGFACHAAGVMMVAARGSIPDFLSIEIANAIALLAYAFGTAGLLTIDRRPIKAWSLIPTAVWIAGMFVPAIRDNLGYRVSLFNIAAACGGFALAVALWAPGAGATTTRRRLAAIFAVHAAIGIAAAVKMMIVPADTIQAIAIAPATAFVSALFVVLIILFGAKILMEQSEKRLLHLAATDTLTGVFNRRGFFDRFKALKADAMREDGQIALILFDLDHFKLINDRHGHSAGDDVLVAFSTLARNRIGDQGTFGRLGGEEFAAALVVHDAAQVHAVAEAIRAAFEALAIRLDGQAVRTTVSSGIVLRSARNASIDVMMTSADRALYAAKDLGRNRVVAAGDVDGTEAATEDAVDRADGQVAMLQAIAAAARGKDMKPGSDDSSLTGS